MLTDVAKRQSAQKGIAQSMEGDIGVRMTDKPQFIGNRYATKPQSPVGSKSVSIKTDAYPKFHLHHHQPFCHNLAFSRQAKSAKEEPLH
jgi:hypothetical protein